MTARIGSLFSDAAEALLRTVAWWANTVLITCWPEPETAPAPDAPAAQQLVDREAEEEVAEPAVGCTCPPWGNPNWPHRHGCPADTKPAPIQSSFAVAPRLGAANDAPRPSDHSPVPDVGRPNLTVYELRDAAQAARGYANGDLFWHRLAERLESAADDPGRPNSFNPVQK